MNKLVLSALAASVAIGTTNASEGDWAGLDAELNTLTTSLDSHGGPALSGYLEAGYDTDDGTGVSQWGLGRTGLSVSGSSGGYGYHMDIDGSAEGSDAYLTFEMGGIGWTMGQFRAPTTGNHLVNEEDMHFGDRSALGGGGARTTGLMASGNMDALGYMIHFSADEDLTARLTYDVMSSDDGINLSVAYSTQDIAGQDSSWMEANLSSGPFGLAATMGNGGGDDATCYIATYDVNDAWAIGLRQEDDDTGADETMDWAITYGDGGARWTFQTNDDDDLAIGCIVGF